MKTLVLKKALTYFAIVFGMGFLLGTIRVLWLEPMLGTRVAELSEMPIMLVTMILAANFIMKRGQQLTKSVNALGVGMIALLLLLSIEFSVVLWLQNISFQQYLDSRDSVAFTAYIISLLLFMLMPYLVNRRA
ncbi:hypothetical protein [Sulfurimonas marina]|uniref:Uncharacterized protein n=1 Tax=Sulfurimonas marina TaxID=2590551 RepID=A0A7M1AUP9_9BACT|nr:hypothetical protein [Sulfurimonas marina]QOP41106.1 hypothetical protein FJR03_04850 [Sulfurimonas marina]